MDRDHVQAIVTKLICREAPELDTGAEAVPPAASFETLGVDSMTVVDIVAAVEGELGIAIPDEELGSISTVERLVELAYARTEEKQ